MITFPTPIQSRLTKKRGTQPILLVEIDWVEGGTVTYSDTTYAGALSKLISVGTVDSIGNSNFGDRGSSQISVVLDSTDETVDTIFRNNDVHMRPVRLYLGYSDTVEKALLFDGLINSAVTWDEAGRSLQFEVLNKIEDGLVAFSMEDGNFPIVSEDDRDKVWPLPFGTVCHYQAQRLTTTIKGFLLEGQGAVDPTLQNRICQLEKTTCATITRPVLKAGPEPNSAVTSETVPDPACLARKRNEGCILKDLLSKQQALAKSSFQVRGGEAFPQNKKIKIRVGTVSYTGIMSGTTFTVQNVFHPDVSKISPCRNVRPPALGYRFGLGSEDEANTCSDQGAFLNVGPNSQDCIVATSYGIGGNFYSSCGMNSGGNTLQQIVTGGAAASWEYYDQMPTGQFMWMPPGTDVILQAYEDDLVYMVSLVPGTVTQVLAYRQFGDNKLLSQVPTEWYTVANVNYGGYTCVELRFNTLPSSSDQPGWEDDIIVSFVSSVGPSPVDIIEWLVDTYTDFTVNSANFAAVKATLTEFESNFVVKDRPSVLTLINEIAYQHRMSVRINNGEMSLVYLAEDPSSVRTLTEADLVQSSFNMSYSETESLKTNHKISWKASYVPNVKGEKVDKDIVMRFNIPKYGTSDEEHKWTTQSTFDTIIKCATFWLIRKSNTWVEVEFQTSIEHLDLEVLDAVTLNISQFPTTKIVLQEKVYESDTNTIKWRAWTPIRAGETSEYYWAWPADKTSGIWPLAGEEDQAQIGDGSGLTVVPPVGHPLRVGYVEGESNPVSVGDSFPSDFGFVAPTITCEVPLGNEVVFAQTPIIDPLAKANFQQDQRNKQNGNGGGTSISYEREEKPCTYSGYNPCPDERKQIGDEGEKPPCDPADLPPCEYIVRLNYVIPTSVRNAGCAGPCRSNAPNPGQLCNGNLFTLETAVSSYEAAQAAVTNHNAARAAIENSCSFQIGQVAPSPGTQIKSFSCNGITYTNTKPPTSACPDSSSVAKDLITKTTDPGNNVPEGQSVPEPDVS